MKTLDELEKFIGVDWGEGDFTAVHASNKTVLHLIRALRIAMGHMERFPKVTEEMRQKYGQTQEGVTFLAFIEATSIGHKDCLAAIKKELGECK